MPDELALYHDLTQMGFRDEILENDYSQLEMMELWLDRRNREGFEYENKVGDKTVYKKGYPFLRKV